MRANSEQIQSCDHFDELLRLTYEEFVQGIPNRPEEWVRRRFAVYGIFPKLGWGLLQFAYNQALTLDDPTPLLEAGWRFTRCAHGTYGHDDEMSFQAGSQDYCRLIFPALFTLLQDDRYVRSAFHAQRKMSKGGYPAFTHGVNVLVTLLNPEWPHAEKALARARSFTQSKSGKVIDKNFIGIFLGCLERDEAKVADSITGFHQTYYRTDWGRYKPDTLTLLMKALLNFVAPYAPGAAARLPAFLFTEKESGLFHKLDAAKQHFDGQSRAFAAPLEFLNPLTFEP